MINEVTIIVVLFFMGVKKGGKKREKQKG